MEGVLRVVVVANLKGGVGKSTLCAALAVRSCRVGKRGERRVAIVDADGSQLTLAHWHSVRGGDAPMVGTGEDDPAEAVQKMELDGRDLVWIDTTPNQIDLVSDSVAVADFIVIPCRPSAVDLPSTIEMAQLAKKLRRPSIVVINDAVPADKAAELYRSSLTRAGLRVAETVVTHRIAHSTAYATGQTASEIGPTTAAAKEIERLWIEVAALIGVEP